MHPTDLLLHALIKGPEDTAVNLLKGNRYTLRLCHFIQGQVSFQDFAFPTLSTFGNEVHPRRKEYHSQDAYRARCKWKLRHKFDAVNLKGKILEKQFKHCRSLGTCTFSKQKSASPGNDCDWAQKLVSCQGHYNISKISLWNLESSKYQI